MSLCPGVRGARLISEYSPRSKLVTDLQACILGDPADTLVNCSHVRKVGGWWEFCVRFCVGQKLLLKLSSIYFNQLSEGC